MPTDFPEHACAYARRLAARSLPFARQVYEDESSIRRLFACSIVNRAERVEPEDLQHVSSRSTRLNPANASIQSNNRKIEKSKNLSRDPFGELTSAARCFGLKQRFPDRVLVMTSDRCFMNCRHCTRRGLLGEAQVVRTPEQLAACVDFVRRHPKVRDVLLSGGDALTRTDADILRFVDAFAALDQIDLVRVCTRAVCANPARVTRRLARDLRSVGRGKVWVNTQFNCADEVTVEARRAAARLVDAGIPVSCQTVLLKGVNDTPEAMLALLRALSAARIRPYYVFMCDPVEGIDRFRVPLGTARRIERICAESIGGLSLPRFVADLPSAPRKLPLSALPES